MNIVFSGLHGTGKSTIAKMIADSFGFTFYSTGMAFRELAVENCMSLEEFSKFAEENVGIDEELDKKIIKMADSEEYDYVFDGQLPAYLLGDKAKFKILLQCDERVRIERMAYRDNRSYEEQEKETIAREESERQRFIGLYEIDVADEDLIKKTYDLIVDTTNRGIEEIYSECEYALENIEIFINAKKLKL